MFLLFILPNNYGFLHYFKRRPKKLPDTPTRSLMNWDYIHNKIPWGLVFLLGGGFALSAGGHQTGLNYKLGQYLKGLRQLPPFQLLLVTTILVQFTTELSSNVTVANIVLPVFAEMVIA